MSALNICETLVEGQWSRRTLAEVRHYGLHDRLRCPVCRQPVTAGQKTFQPAGTEAHQPSCKICQH